jgi:hypothetical protein
MVVQHGKHCFEVINRDAEIRGYNFISNYINDMKTTSNIQIKTKAIFQFQNNANGTRECITHPTTITTHTHTTFMEPLMVPNKQNKVESC